MAHERFVTTSDEAYFNDIRKAMLIGTEYSSEATHHHYQDHYHHIDDYNLDLIQN